MMVKGLSEDELLILVNVLWEKTNNAVSRCRTTGTRDECKALMLKLSDARTELIIQRNQDDFDMRQTIAREDR